MKDEFGSGKTETVGTPVRYESHAGSRPMSIVWRLDHPMPARLLPTCQRLAVA